MPKFSVFSIKNLEGCHKSLQSLLYEVIKYIDFTVVCGYRGEKEQNEAYNNGFSKLKYPKSEHNKIPSLAVDLIPYPTGYEDINELHYLAGFIQGYAKSKGLDILWGGRWKKFKDYPHFEIKLSK